MVTYFKAEMCFDQVYHGSITFKIKTLVNNQMIQYNVEIPQNLLIADGYIDVFIDEVKRKIKAEIKKQSEKESSVFEKQEQIEIKNAENNNG